MIPQGFCPVNTFGASFLFRRRKLSYSLVFVGLSLVFSCAIFPFRHQPPGRQSQEFRPVPLPQGGKQLPLGGGFLQAAQGRRFPGVIVQPAQGAPKSPLPARGTAAAAPPPAPPRWGWVLSSCFALLLQLHVYMTILPRISCIIKMICHAFISL